MSAKSREYFLTIGMAERYLSACRGMHTRNEMRQSEGSDQMIDFLIGGMFGFLGGCFFGIILVALLTANGDDHDS